MPEVTDAVVAHPLDEHLEGVLAGHGADFQAAGDKWNVDPTLLAAIAMVESDRGRSGPAKKYNNTTGMMMPRSKNQTGFSKYKSIAENLDATASTLSRKYLQQGKTTIAQIAQDYSPPADPKTGKPVANDPRGSNKKWPGQVTKFYNQMGGTRSDFGPPHVADALPIMGGLSVPDLSQPAVPQPVVQQNPPPQAPDLPPWGSGPPPAPVPSPLPAPRWNPNTTG